MFLVPYFNVNILYVHKLCKDYKCEVGFNEHKCKIQDLQSKMMIESGKECGVL